MSDELYVQGAAARREIGDQTDGELLAVVTSHPGSTMYELAKILEWSFGRTHGSIQRLKEEMKLTTRAARKGGKLVNLVFPFQAAKADIGEISVDRKLLDNPDEWKTSIAFAYCLTKDTVGFSPRENIPWKNAALYEDRAVVSYDGGGMKIALSKKLQDFYMSGNTDLDVASSGNRVIVSFLQTFLPISGTPKEMSALESQIESDTRRATPGGLYRYQAANWHLSQKRLSPSFFKQYKDTKFPEQASREEIHYREFDRVDRPTKTKVAMAGRAR